MMDVAIAPGATATAGAMAAHDATVVPGAMTVSAAAPPPEAPVTPATAPAAVAVGLLTEQLADVPGKELTMTTVEYPPGGSTMPHRHDAYVLVYVLEGTVQMQVRGQKLVTLKVGDTFLERPNDIHEVSRNASMTAPAKFLVVALKSSGKPLTRGVAAPQ
jgi:quercetin dioxygenase-like cupin family protein